MTHFDVFNGDADGICSLLQLRLATPIDAVLITGAKRDIALLQRVVAEPGDKVTALDISVAVNRQALLALLERGVTIEYFDHHFAGELPTHAGLKAHIDTSPGVCTGILVDRYLAGKHRIWAVVAAFGDNLAGAAQELAAPLVLAVGQLAALQELGESLAYNAYGDSETDLIIPPAELYRVLWRCADPFRFMHTEPLFGLITAARRFARWWVRTRCAGNSRPAADARPRPASTTCRLTSCTNLYAVLIEHFARDVFACANQRNPCVSSGQEAERQSDPQRTMISFLACLAMATRQANARAARARALRARRPRRRCPSPAA